MKARGNSTTPMELFTINNLSAKLRGTSNENLSRSMQENSTLREKIVSEAVAKGVHPLSATKTGNKNPHSTLSMERVSTPVIYQDPSTSTPSLVVQTQYGNLPTPAKPIISEGGIARVCITTHLFPTIEEGTEEDNDGEESLMVPDQEM